MASNVDGTVALNNYLQDKGKASSLSWEDKPAGPRHAVEWTSICKIDGKVVASGNGLQKNAARDAAARAALAILTAEAEEAATGADN
ncbi:hypothetical protein C8T65DRAFT_637263 [Cerioporus squamosus]|nr:hypothetical protein C8T65DRAFT_637263 [Cerioporus squamosus]